MHAPIDTSLPHIVVVGAGFGGLTFARDFPTDLARITVVDRQNHHLFQPLLYQVATGILSQGEIAPPTREILSGQDNAKVLLGEVTELTPVTGPDGRVTLHRRPLAVGDLRSFGPNYVHDVAGAGDGAPGACGAFSSPGSIYSAPSHGERKSKLRKSCAGCTGSYTTRFASSE